MPKTICNHALIMHNRGPMNFQCYTYGYMGARKFVEVQYILTDHWSYWPVSLKSFCEDCYKTGNIKFVFRNNCNKNVVMNLTQQLVYTIAILLKFLGFFFFFIKKHFEQQTKTYMYDADLRLRLQSNEIKKTVLMSC